jgi:hypothetical protein
MRGERGEFKIQSGDLRYGTYNWFISEFSLLWRAEGRGEIPPFGIDVLVRESYRAISLIAPRSVGYRRMCGYCWAHYQNPSGWMKDYEMVDIQAEIKNAKNFI